MHRSLHIAEPFVDLSALCPGDRHIQKNGRYEEGKSASEEAVRGHKLIPPAVVCPLWVAKGDLT